MTATFITLIGMLITAIGLWWSIKSFKKQLRLNFFAEYTKRYQKIILNFPESVNKKDFNINKLSKVSRDKTLRYMRAYFDLCSEEYFLWMHDDLDAETWKEWESGIKYAFTKPAFIQAWNIIKLDTKYYPAFTLLANNSIPTAKKA